MNRDEMIERGVALGDELETLTERYGTDEALWPAGQRTRADNLRRGIAALDRDIEDLDTRERRRADLLAKVRSGEAETIPGTDTTGATRTHRSRSNPWGGLDEQMRMESSTGLRTRALDAIEIVEGLPTERRAALTEMIDSDPTSKSAMFLVAASDPHYRTAFEHILRDPVQGHLMWSTAERDAFVRVQHMRAALSLTDANGGYLVALTLDPNAVLTNVGSTNPFRRICRMETTATEDANLTTSAGVTAEWLPEATEAADASPTFTRVTIKAEKLAASITASYEIMQDSNIGAQLPRLLQDSFDNAEAAAFATGSGTNEPTGVITTVAAVTASRVSPTTGGSFSSASVADIYKVHNALTARSRNDASAAWVANNTILNIIRQMDTYGGSSFWANLNDGTPAKLLGMPVYESSAMTSVVTTGSNILVAGSFVDYAIVDRLGVTLAYDPMVVGGSGGRPTGQGQWFGFKRVGGKTLNADSFRVLQL